MRAVDTVWAELAASGQFRFETKLEINGTEYTKITAPRISRPAMTSPLSVGNCYSSSLKVSILTEDEIATSAAVKVLGRLTNGTAATVCSEWMSFGTYYVANQSDKTVASLVTLECYDAMTKANAPYAAKSAATAWPVSQKYAVEEIAALMGVTVDPRTVINEGEDYVVYLDTTLTQWQVLCYIAACHGGNFVITEDGALRLIPLVSATQEEGTEVVNVLAVTGNLDTGHPVIVEGFQMTDGLGNTYTAGDMDGHVLKIENNPYANQQICRDLLASYYGCIYIPYTATKSLYDPAAELGDYVVIGDKVSSVLYAQDLTLDFAFRGDLKATSSEEVTGKYPYTSPAMLAIRTEVSRAKSEFKQTTDSIEARVEDAEGNLSLIEQLIGSIKLSVSGTLSDGTNSYAEISLHVGDNVSKGYVMIDGNVSVDGSLSAEALYAAMGDIADLTVDKLSTSRRIVKYLAGDESDDNYLRIHDQYIEFVSGVRDPAAVGSYWDINGEEILTTGYTQATNPNGGLLYWEYDPDSCSIGSDGYPYTGGHRVFTTTERTEWPVMVYIYTDLVKRSIGFEKVSGFYVPVDTFGAGDEAGRQKGKLLKDTEGLQLAYETQSGKTLGVRMRDDGYTDVFGLRKSTGMNFSEWDDGRFYERVDGDTTRHEYGVMFDAEGRPVRITDSDGHATEIYW